MIEDTLFLVYARAANGAIGKDGGLPWHIPADLKHFRPASRHVCMFDDASVGP